ncbi:hypothetical protein FACS1894201_02900 [Bacteroidia bacterium]|nr:hypothetical protein FACS1894201_02900 [Bacteroidia bacterium]
MNNMVSEWCNKVSCSFVDNFSTKSLVMSEILLNTHTHTHTHTHEQRHIARAKYNNFFLNNNTIIIKFKNHGDKFAKRAAD